MRRVGRPSQEVTLKSWEAKKLSLKAKRADDIDGYKSATTKACDHADEAACAHRLYG